MFLKAAPWRWTPGVRTLIRVRFISVICVFISAVLLTSAYVSRNYVGDALGLPGEPNSTLWPSLFASLIALIHLAYLWLVNDLNVLSKPVERLSLSTDFLLPLLLGLSYVGFALAILSGKSAWSVAALAALMTLYVLWGFKDFREHQRNITTIRKRQLRVWIFIDLVSFLILAWIFIDKVWLRAIPPAAAQLIKDGVIAGCLIFFIISAKWYKAFAWRDHYRNIYTDFLSYMPRDITFEWRDDYTLSNEFVRLQSAESGLRVLDVGCANGQRSLELFGLLGINKERIGLMVGLEENSDWREPFLATMRANNVKAEFCHSTEFHRQRRSESPRFDVIILSHVFYESESDTNLAYLGSVLVDGGIVLVRGYAPTSVFWRVGRDRAQNLLDVSYDAFWVSSFLKPWVDSQKLRLLCGGALDEAGRPNPCATIKVEYPLSGRGALLEFIEFIHGVSARERVEQVLDDASFTGSGATAIDDLLYVLCKPAP